MKGSVKIGLAAKIMNVNGIIMRKFKALFPVLLGVTLLSPQVGEAQKIRYAVDVSDTSFGKVCNLREESDGSAPMPTLACTQCAIASRDGGLASATNDQLTITAIVSAVPSAPDQGAGKRSEKYAEMGEVEDS